MFCSFHPLADKTNNKHLRKPFFKVIRKSLYLVKRDLSFNLFVIRDCPSQGDNFFRSNVKAFLDFNVTREGRHDL